MQALWIAVVLVAGPCFASPAMKYLATMTQEEIPLAMQLMHNAIMEAERREEAADAIPEAAAKLGLTSLVNAVGAAGLKETLEGAGPFTVFGPNNQAFMKIPAIKNTTVLADILKYHVLSGEVKSTDLKNDLVASTVEGKKLRINIYEKTATKDAVYTAQCSPINLSMVDQAASNGVIHVLDRVMIPPAGTIVAALSANPDYKILVRAVVAAKLADTLNGDGPFTVFAPTDRAFEKLPRGTIERLLKNPTELAKVLTYHVVPGTACSAGLSSGSVKTVEGQEVKVTVSEAGVQVNEARVIYADGSVTNGVVHAIDRVLLPPNFEL